jgi:hypothetical protein
MPRPASPLSAAALVTPIAVAREKNVLRDIPEIFPPVVMSTSGIFNDSMIKPPRDGCSGSWSASMGFSCGPSGTPNSLDVFSTQAVHRWIGNVKNISSELSDSIQAAATRRYAHRLIREFLSHPIMGFPSGPNMPRRLWARRGNPWGSGPPFAPTTTAERTEALKQYVPQRLQSDSHHTDPPHMSLKRRYASEL